MVKILVATTNTGKMKELGEILGRAAAQIEWVDLRDFPDASDVEEDGLTFAANAGKKAMGYAAQTGLWTLADDSGLVIDALDGAPGVYSARFAADEAPPDCDRKTLDRINYEKVLRLMAEVPDEKRTARFVCHLTLAAPDGILLEATGRVEGVIGSAPVGNNGFGYDPIFFIPSAGKTAAQLDSGQKNRISHRANAAGALLPQLKALLDRNFS